MNPKLIWGIGLALLMGLASCQSPTEAPADSAENPDAPRIVTLSGFLTELVYDLGHGAHLVGVDVTSVAPAAVDTLPKLGHISQLNAEAILALQPTLILVDEAQRAQAPALAQLEASGIRVIGVRTTYHLHNALNAAQQLAEALPFDESRLQALREQITQDSTTLAAQLDTLTSDAPKVLFIYARGAGRLMIGGAGTAADAAIRLAGGQNAAAHIDGFTALTPEALVEIAPSHLLLFSSGLASLDGKAGLRQIPGMAQTPAFQQDRIIAMDGHYLTAFGSQIGKAITELAHAIHTP